MQLITYNYACTKITKKQVTDLNECIARSMSKLKWIWCSKFIATVVAIPIIVIIITIKGTYFHNSVNHYIGPERLKCIEFLRWRKYINLVSQNTNVCKINKRCNVGNVIY